jgi:peroxiredoxin
MKKKLRNVLAASLLAGALAISMANSAVAQTKQPESASMPKVGDVAPDFTLKYFDGNDLKDVSLSQYRGKKNVVLGFFIFAFTGG